MNLVSAIQFGNEDSENLVGKRLILCSLPRFKLTRLFIFTEIATHSPVLVLQRKFLIVDAVREFEHPKSSSTLRRC
jgi:hypothetical protein